MGAGELFVGVKDCASSAFAGGCGGRHPFLVTSMQLSASCLQVCDVDHSFRQYEARKVCTLLGLPQPGHALGGSYFGVGNGPIWLSSLSCNNDEDDLNECDHDPWGQYDQECSATTQMGVVCGAPLCE